jgi:cytochrome c oxidase subunit II
MKITRTRIVTGILLAIGIVATSTRIVLPVAAKQGSPRTIVVHATRYAFAPAEITLKKGEPVTLELVSDDVLHSLVVRGLSINLKDLKPGEVADLTVTPDQTGDFKGTCGIFCGSGHGTMSLKVHVVDGQ